MLPDRKLLVAVGLALVVVTAGCGASGGGGPAPLAQEGARSGADGGGGGDASAPATQAPESTGDPDGSFDLDTADRAIVRSGQVDLEVSNFDAARRDLSRAVRRHGGFVSDSRERLHRVDNETYTTGVLILRVPRGNFSALLDRVKERGTVLESSTSSDDVTERLVDIRARLENLRAQRDRLRTLYDRANDTEAVLEVNERLSAVQERIERLEAQQTSLERRVALSTVRVELAEPRPDPEPDPVEKWYEVGVVTAFLESVDGTVTTLRAITVTLAYALPYLVVFVGPLVVLGYGIRRRRNDGGPSDDGSGDPDDAVRAGPSDDEDGG